LQVRISWDEYRDKIVDYGHIKIFAMASVQETKQSWSEEDDFQLEKPKLDVQVAYSRITLVIHRSYVKYLNLL
jgi:transglutaminase 1